MSLFSEIKKFFFLNEYARLTVQCFSLVNIATLALFISFYKLSRLFFLFIF